MNVNESNSQIEIRNSDQERNVTNAEGISSIGFGADMTKTPDYREVMSSAKQVMVAAQ